jgi:hypothetical protein
MCMRGSQSRQRHRFAPRSTLKVPSCTAATHGPPSFLFSVDWSVTHALLIMPRLYFGSHSTIWWKSSVIICTGLLQDITYGLEQATSLVIGAAYAAKFQPFSMCRHIHGFRRGGGLLPPSKLQQNPGMAPCSHHLSGGPITQDSRVNILWDLVSSRSRVPYLDPRCVAEQQSIQSSQTRSLCCHLRYGIFSIQRIAAWR